MSGRAGHAAFLTARFDEITSRFDAVHAKIALIAAGHLVLQRQLQEHIGQSKAEHREIVALLTSSHRNLDRRVARLESKRRRGGTGR